MWHLMCGCINAIPFRAGTAQEIPRVMGWVQGRQSMLIAARTHRHKSHYTHGTMC